MEMWSKLKDFIKIQETNKPGYQIYDKLVFEEVEDAKNYELPNIPEKCLYDTNRIRAHKKQRIYLVQSKDYSSEDNIDISLIKRKDLYDKTRKLEGYYHIAAIQVLIKYLGNAGLDIPVRISIRDERQLDVKQSIIGIWSSNLYTGAVYTEMQLDCLLNISDKNIDQALRLAVKADNQVLEGSKNLAISTRCYIQWQESVQPFRKEIRTEKGKIDPGQAVVIKSGKFDVCTIPQPIPIDSLTYNLEFDFPNRKPKLQRGESSTTNYIIQGENSLRIRLKTPEHLSSSRSRRHDEKNFNKFKDDENSEDE